MSLYLNYSEGSAVLTGKKKDVHHPKICQLPVQELTMKNIRLVFVTNSLGQHQLVSRESQAIVSESEEEM